MRIEISAGGINGCSVAQLQSDMQTYIADKSSVISSFKAVNNTVCQLPGGTGGLQEALDEMDLRIQEEEEAQYQAESVQTRTNDFLQLAGRIDSQVASDVDQNREQLYCPWQSPNAGSEKTKWYDAAWNWIKGAAKKTWNWISDTAKKAWNGLAAFYNEHKKVIDTVFIVAGAIAAIAAVVTTGGAALVPLLGALGLASSTAAAISTAVAVVAVVSTVGSSVLNIIDVWEEIDDPTFNTWQKSLNIVSFVSNGLYSIGSIYNSIKSKVLLKSSAKDTKKELWDYQKSEMDVTNHVGSEYKSQQSINTNDLSKGTYAGKGTIRPDNIKTMQKGKAVDNFTEADFFDVIEVKNYKIEIKAGRDSLKSEIKRQAWQRYEVLSQNGATVKQSYYVEMRGHNISVQEWKALLDSLSSSLPPNTTVRGIKSSIFGRGGIKIVP